MTTTLDVAIVGAGPYGLSLGAHLQASSLSVQVFGSPFQTWRTTMPKGMLLKSDGFASNLSDPRSELTLERFCRDHGLPYDATRLPVPLETFVNYGAEFQRRFVPKLDPRQVVDIAFDRHGFRLKLEDGYRITARKVVLAVGITHFAYTPPEFENLSADLVSHSSAHRDLASLRGKSVFVVGGGSSAIDTAALLHEAGCNVSVVARRSAIAFNQGPGSAQRTLWERLRRPSSGLGSSWSSWFFCNAPGVFRLLPARTRLDIVKKYLRPAPGWPMRERVVGKIPMFLGCRDLQIKVDAGKARLTFKDAQDKTLEGSADHVILATGYKADVRRLRFLGEEVRSRLETLENTPVLSGNFESSVPGLYFVGLAAANSFGPMLRFAFGADYTARHLTLHLVHGAAYARQEQAMETPRQREPQFETSKTAG